MTALAFWLAGGVGLGLLYFRLVRQSAERLVSGRPGSTGIALGLGAVRMAGLAAVLVVAALQGAGPLVAVALGLLLGRTAELRRAA